MKMRTLGLAVALGVAVLALAAPAAAQEVVYQKHTVVEFGDDTIEGDLSRPDSMFVESRKHLKHEKLIKVRESFHQEILQSVRAL